MKLVHTIERSNISDIIITIDDDILYNKSIIDSLLDNNSRYPDDIISIKSFIFGDYMNSDLDRSRYPNIQSPKYPYADVAEGFSGVLYPMGIFNKINKKDFIKELLDLNKINVCRYSDDFIISYLFLKYDTKIRNVDSDIHNTLKTLEFGTYSDALFNGSGLTEQELIELDKLGNNKYFDKNMLKYKLCYNTINNKK